MQKEKTQKNIKKHIRKTFRKEEATTKETNLASSGDAVEFFLVKRSAGLKKIILHSALAVITSLDDNREGAAVHFSLEHPALPEHPDRDPAALGVEGEQFAERADLEVARGRLRGVRHLLGCVVLVDLRLCNLSGGRNRPLLMIAVPGWKIWLYLATKYLLE